MVDLHVQQPSRRRPESPIMGAIGTVSAIMLDMSRSATAGFANPPIQDRIMDMLMYVTYSGDANTRFDRDYYVRDHVRIVMAAWGRHGLLSCDAFFPASQAARTIAIAECRFRDRAALEAALASAETPSVMADVARFTDAVPVQHVPAPLHGPASSIRAGSGDS